MGSGSFKDYIDEQKRLLEEKARKATSRIADDLTKEANRAIDEFYSWSPRRYKRQEAIRKINKPKRYYRNPHNTIYRGGVELPASTGGSYHANYLPGHPAVSDEYIADLFYAGRHGATECFPRWVLNHIRNMPPTMSPSPIEMIETKYNEISNNLANYFE